MAAGGGTVTNGYPPRPFPLNRPNGGGAAEWPPGHWSWASCPLLLHDIDTRDTGGHGEMGKVRPGRHHHHGRRVCATPGLVLGILALALPGHGHDLRKRRIMALSGIGPAVVLPVANRVGGWARPVKRRNVQACSVTSDGRRRVGIRVRSPGQLSAWVAPRLAPSDRILIGLLRNAGGRPASRQRAKVGPSVAGLLDELLHPPHVHVAHPFGEHVDQGAQRREAPERLRAVLHRQFRP